MTALPHPHLPRLPDRPRGALVAGRSEGSLAVTAGPADRRQVQIARAYDPASTRAPLMRRAAERQIPRLASALPEHARPNPASKERCRG